MPLVTTACGVLRQQDGAWGEYELLAESRLELQGSAQSDHVLPNRSAMPIEAGARRALFERHLGRLPGPRSMCGAFQLRQLEVTLLEVRLVILASIEPDQRKRHRLCLLTTVVRHHLHGDHPAPRAASGSYPHDELVAFGVESPTGSIGRDLDLSQAVEFFAYR